MGNSTKDGWYDVEEDCLDPVYMDFESRLDRHRPTRFGSDFAKWEDPVYDSDHLDEVYLGVGYALFRQTPLVPVIIWCSFAAATCYIVATTVASYAAMA